MKLTLSSLILDLNINFLLKILQSHPLSYGFKVQILKKSVSSTKYFKYEHGMNIEIDIWVFMIERIEPHIWATRDVQKITEYTLCVIMHFDYFSSFVKVVDTYRNNIVGNKEYDNIFSTFEPLHINTTLSVTVCLGRKWRENGEMNNHNENWARGRGAPLPLKAQEY